MSSRAATQRSRGRGANRYAIFVLIITISALSPALPHSMTPDGAWWLVAGAILLVMYGVGWLGAHRRYSHWLNALAPLLLFPAIYALRCADGNHDSGFAPLILLPVVWFALYGRLRDVVLAVVAATLTLVLPMVVVGAPQYPSSTWRGTLLLLVLAAALGPLIFRLVESARRANRALRRSEVEFRAAFEDAPIGMAITGLRGADAWRFVRVNRALCELFGRSARELTSTPITELTHPDDVDLTNYAFSVATDPSTPHRIEKRYVHKSGRTIWAAVSFSVIHDDNEEPSHLVCQIEDVGRHRESDQALLDAFETDREATEQLQRLEQMRVDMASTVSHEMRTPLTSAAGYVELLAEGDAGPLTAEQRSMLDTIARSLTRLDGIVDDVLGLTHTDQPQRRDVATAELDSVVRAAVASVSLQAATRGQDLISHIALDGVTVAGEAGRLERALVNLLTNAIKFTPEDGRITVQAGQDATTARVSVTDTGIGISAENQKRIFERFFRVDRDPTDPVTPGSGLGLAIVRTIATQYGGDIDVQSEPGHGSTFTVTLPLRPSTE